MPTVTRCLATLTLITLIALAGPSVATAFDLGIAAVEPFSTDPFVGRCDSVRPTVRVENNSPFASAAVQVMVSIRSSGGAVVYGPVIASGTSLQPGTSMSVTMAMPWLPSTEGDYVVTAAISAAGDISTDNDTLRAEVIVTNDMLSRAQAFDVVRTSVIESSPFRDGLVAWLVDGVSGDSLLMPGDVVAPWDSSFVDTVDAPSYLFWIDNQPGVNWLHSSTFVFVDACSGTLTRRDAQSWPVINGIERLTFDGPPVRGSRVRTGTLIPAYTPVATDNASDCALIIAGENREGWDSTAILNDVQRAKEALNGAGPRIAPDRMVVVGADPGGPVGATRQQVLDAIRAVGQKGCRRVYIYYAGHGYNGGMILKNARRNGTERLSYEDFAKALLENNIRDVVVTIMACHSGSAVADLGKAKVPPSGRGPFTRLTGVVITSSPSNRPTTGAPDGSPFTREILDGLKNDSADANRDGTVTIAEALAWAVIRNDTVRSDGPGVTILGGPRPRPLDPPQVSGGTYSNDGGGALVYRFVRVCYDTTILADGSVRVRCRTSLCVENQTTRPHRGERRVTIVCFDERGRETTVGTHTIDLPPGGRRCFHDLPADCMRFEVRPGPPRRVAGPLATMSAASGFVNLTAGDPVLIAVPVVADAGTRFVASVDGPAAWTLAPSSAAFTMTAAFDSAAIFIEGIVPDTATTGGVATLRLVDEGSGDTIIAQYELLLNGTIEAPITSGLFERRWIDLFSTITPASSVASFGGSVIVVHDSGTSRVAAGGRLVLEGTMMAVDEGIAHALVIDGMLRLVGSTFVRLANGLVLNGASAHVDGGMILQSRRDGLTLTGDQSDIEVRSVVIDESARNGITASGASDAVLRDVNVSGSGAADLVLVSSSSMRFIDGSIDPAKLSVDATSRLERAWTTGVVVIDSDGAPIPNAIAEWRDASDALVGRDTVGAEGLSAPRELLAFEQEGATREDKSRYELTVRLAGRDSTIVYTADADRYLEVVFGETASAAPADETASGVRLGAIVPNPGTAIVRIPFSLQRHAPVRIALVDMIGRETVVLDGVFDAGEHVAVLDARPLPAGTYLCLMRTGAITRARVVVVR